MHNMISTVKATTQDQKILHKEIAKGLSDDLLHQKFIEAAFELDASIVEPYIPEEMQLQDLDKYRFLADLKDRFERIRQQHPEGWQVKLADYICRFCNRGKPLAAFEVFAGNDLEPFSKFGYYVDSDLRGITKDIYICNGIIKTSNY